MKAKLNLAIVLSLLTLSIISVAKADRSNICITPHIGIDYKFWQMEPRQSDSVADYSKVFPDITRAGTIYIGTRINKVWGIDFGYDHSAKKDKWRTYDTDNLVFGQPAAIGDASEVTMRVTAWHLMGLFYWEVYKNIELVFHAGAAWLQPKSTVIYYPVASPGFARELSYKEESKVSGRFGLGAQYLFLRNFGVRALIIFDQTRRVNLVGTNHNTVAFDISPYKSSTSYNVGFFAEFTGI